ncbi:MAG TPA: NAD(P)-dependent alcohol dehydrogenase [Anaerolineae bacterium]|nr:NAD(P)-dependent alcohol dehydrogenase [Anaerolineae bacterium]HOQ99381.1 NAD(P)-dependent alcohol dehydrogenase [Anaerolineae bacterium]HPL28470.1 NAD(P)-dependent alcohol dehydrogenase [Anaerolineae bacterium]
MEIKAAVVSEMSGGFTIERLELCDPNDDEVVVRIVGVGICHTDLAGRDGHLPIPPPPSVFGHEGAGIVAKAGRRVTRVKPGDHVVLAWDYCGACAPCKSGKELYCLNFFRHNFHGARPDGSITLRQGDQAVHGSFFNQSSFADYALANERNVVKVRDDVPLEILGPMGCGVMTGAGAVMNALRPRPGAAIAVFGAGAVGLSAVLAAAVCGCAIIIAVDVNAGRLQVAKELGATHTVNAAEVDPVETIRRLTGGGVEFSLECVGSPRVLRQAVDVLPRLGVCGLVGVVPPGTEVALDMDLIMNGRTVRGILGGDAVPDLFIPRLIELYRQGRFPFDRLITLYPFEGINQAVEDMQAGRVIKPVLRL